MDNTVVKPKVLIIDDNKPFAWAFKRALVSLYHPIYLIFENQLETIGNLLEKNKNKIFILVDTYFETKGRGTISGVEIVKDIRTKLHSRVPIAVMGMKHEKDLGGEIMSYKPGYYFLNKPFSLFHILCVIKRAKCVNEKDLQKIVEEQTKEIAYSFFHKVQGLIRTVGFYFNEFLKESSSSFGKFGNNIAKITENMIKEMENIAKPDPDRYIQKAYTTELNKILELITHLYKFLYSGAKNTEMNKVIKIAQKVIILEREASKMCNAVLDKLK
ncbi:hypothetical protein KAW65_00400 [candidate division WOR-3 bacterium]|nr:hypothetical protein [candidate division WOR-3 bacterium]